MAQHDYVIANGTGAAVRSDLNNALAAIVSQNSGATEPATTYAFQFWADTTTGTLKLRNSANSAWIELLQLDGTLTMEDGTEALPGLSFRNDLDTGLWRPGTNQLAISTNAVERVEFGASEVVFNDGGANYDFRVEGDTNANLLFVDASADAVGIGTSSVDSPLHINAASYATASNGTVLLRSTTSASNDGSQITFGTDAGRHAAIAGRTESGTIAGYLQLGTRGSSGDILERVRIDSSGRVGIGTTSPAEKFDVRRSGFGNVAFFADDSASGLFIKTASGVAGLDSRNNTTALNFLIDGSEKARLDTSGRLLVGTSTARSNLFAGGTAPQLQVEGTSFAQTIFSIVRNENVSTSVPGIALGKTRGSSNGANTVVQSGDNLGLVDFQGADGTNLIAAARISADVDGTPGTNDMPGRLVFSTTADGASSPTERMRIRNNGTVMIGATTVPSPGGPSTNTFVASTSANDGGWTGIFQSTGASSNRGVVVSYSGASPNDGFNEPFFFQDSTTPRFYVTSNGGVKNYSANNANLSDRNVKKDITPAAGTWDCIKEWEIVNYRYQDQPDDADLNLGVIAQQVAESCPEVVTVFEKAKDDQPEKLGVKEQQMYWMAIKALQEAQVRIEQLEAKVAALESA